MSEGMLRHAAWIARALGRAELSPFSSEDIQELASSIGVRRVSPGTRLMTQGKPVTFIGLIEEGEIELYHRAGLRRVMIQILRPGDTMGDIPYFCQKDAPFSARAITDVVLIQLDDTVLDRLFQTRPALCRRFLYSLAARLERTQLRLLQLTRGDLRSQVAALLLDETEGHLGSIRLPQSTLAELLGATRPSVNRVLKAFEAEGLIGVDYRRVEIRDRDALRALVPS